MTTFFLALAIFGICFLMMGIGFFIRGVVLKGSCGGAAQALGEDASCGVCGKKERELCPNDDETGLLDISQLSNPHKPMNERRDPGYQV